MQIVVSWIQFYGIMNSTCKLLCFEVSLLRYNEKHVQIVILYGNVVAGQVSSGRSRQTVRPCGIFIFSIFSGVHITCCCPWLQAPYLPWVLLGFSFLLNNSVMVDLLGIVVGHTYYFLEDVFPNRSGGVRILRTPHVL